MQDSVKKMLGQIAKFLEKKPINDVEELWQILSALRGPDKGFEVEDQTILDDDAKAATSEVIRFHALGQAAASRVGAFNHADSDGRKRCRALLTKLSREHFVHHASMAFKALGLEW